MQGVMTHQIECPWHLDWRKARVGQWVEVCVGGHQRQMHLLRARQEGYKEEVQVGVCSLYILLNDPRSNWGSVRERQYNS